MDPDGTLVAQPKKYISKILDSFHQMFPGESLPQVKSPLDKNDHPELDNSELASDDLITKFMCMVGQLQWAVTLGRYDILAYVMSMSRFRLAPKVGCRIFEAYHLEFSSLIRQLVGLGDLFCQLNGPEQGGLITMI